MKRIKLLCFLVICSLLLTVATAFADEEIMPSYYDEVGYLTEEEFDSITEMLDALREKYDFDTAIMVEEYMTSATAMESADDIFDYNPYGIGKNKDGILFYICDETREYHFSTHGYGITAFNDNGLRYLEEKVLPYLKADDFYGAFRVYADTCDELLEMAKNGEPYNEKDLTIPILIVIALPVILAFVLMRMKLAAMKTANKQESAANYMKPGSMQMAYQRDMFLFSRIDKREKPKSNSGTHTSSSGETHGGRGGSF